jgi:2-polyprenyl-6-methoxyphenol hydroxylase-like FAD-dependent oxidoreductase
MRASEKCGAEVPVIIVGGGPVGMVLAMNLDAWGIHCVVVNDAPRSRDWPKGNTHNTRSMEHYRRLGVAQQLRALGLPHDQSTDVSYHTRLSGWELSRIAMPSEAENMRTVAQSRPTDQIVEPLLRCNQMYVESFLFDHIKTLPHVELRYGWECTGFQDHGDAVTATIEQRDSRESETIKARFLVGCDGGQGFVRHHLGIRYVGDEPRAQAFGSGAMLGVHIRAPELYRSVIRKPGFQWWFINPHLRSNLIALDGVAEFKFGLRVDTTDPASYDRMTTAAFHASIGKEIPFEIIGHSNWTAGLALVAERFVVGNVCLAGDSAHLFTPTGGFGLNTGIDDTANLAWKLAALVQEWGGRGLLQSYEAERRPIAIRNTSAAKRLAHSVGDVPVGKAIEDDSTAGAAARHETGTFLTDFDREFSSLGVQLGARYDNSPLIASDKTAPPPDDDLKYVPSSVPGGRTPHLWLDEKRDFGSSLFDRLGRGFTLLCLGGDPAKAAPLIAAAQKRSVPIETIEIRDSDARDLYERDLVLIRPDQHVGWRGNACPNQPERVMSQLVGDY